MSMSGYTKLFNSILASTIWRSNDKTRLVWITLLAMADKDGICEGSIPGLADLSRVSIEDCEAALAELQAPDPYSRTSEHEGRRIEVIDGVGWRLLNHAKYRAKMSEDERREYNRQKQAEWRAKQKALQDGQDVSNGVNDNNSQSAMSAHTEADTDTKAKADKKKSGKSETENAVYVGTVLAGITKSLSLKKLSLTQEREWTFAADLCFENGFTAAEFVDCFTELNTKHKYTILPKYVIDQLPAFVNKSGKPDSKPQWQTDRENCGKCNPDTGYILVGEKHEVCKHA